MICALMPQVIRLAGNSLSLHCGARSKALWDVWEHFPAGAPRGTQKPHTPSRLPQRPRAQHHPRRRAAHAQPVPPAAAQPCPSGPPGFRKDPGRGNAHARAGAAHARSGVSAELAPIPLASPRAGGVRGAGVAGPSGPEQHGGAGCRRGRGAGR